MKKNVLVTGADGFIGSHLVELLVAQGAKVRALSYYNAFNNWGWLEDIGCLNKIEVVTGDIRDPHFCIGLTKNIDIVYHLAALIAIPYSYMAPDSYIDTNIKGTLNMMQAALTNNCERIIHTSTSEVYGTARYVPIDEGHPLQPQSPYSATKIGADAIAASFYHAYNLPVIIARPFNTYGPRQSARAVIPTIITQIASGKQAVKVGDITPTRDFNFVTDICNGFLLLSQAEGIDGQVTNIGSNSEISVKDLFAMICRLMDRDAYIVEEKQRVRPEKSEVYRLMCDNAKMRSVTGYKPAFSLEEGLKITIDWYRDKKNLEKYKTEIYNV
jgi:NAD dependent epimerase/dehydratase